MKKLDESMNLERERLLLCFNEVDTLTKQFYGDYKRLCNKFNNLFLEVTLHLDKKEKNKCKKYVNKLRKIKSLDGVLFLHTYFKELLTSKNILIHEGLYSKGFLKKKKK